MPEKEPTQSEQELLQQFQLQAAQSNAAANNNKQAQSKPPATEPDDPTKPDPSEIRTESSESESKPSPDEPGLIESIKKSINSIRSSISSSVAAVMAGLGTVGAFLKDGIGKIIKTISEKINPPETTPTNDSTTKSKDTPKTDKKDETTEEKPTDTTETSTEKADTKVKIEEDEKFKHIFKLFQDEFKDPIKTIYYPSSGYHSLSESIPKDSKITYLDKDKAVTVAHKAAGHETINEDIATYTPTEKPDLTLLFSPSVEEKALEHVLKSVQKDKFVICSNYQKTAEFMEKNEDFKLVGIIPLDASTLYKKDLKKYLDEEKSKAQGAGGFYYIYKRAKVTEKAAEAKKAA